MSDTPFALRQRSEPECIELRVRPLPINGASTQGAVCFRILVADEHPVVRSGLRQFLGDAADCRIAGEAGTGREALERVAAEHWDLLMLDLGLPDLNGLEVLKRAKQTAPALPVLVFSRFPEDDYAMTVIEAGAAGYLQKDSAPGQIIDAIRRAVRGEHYLSPQFVEKLLARTATAGVRRPHDLLSKREWAVMRLLSTGVSLAAIGQSLHLSPKTVSTYRARLLEKLELRNNAELTRYVVEHKLGQ
jgi:DNA-binding NarL/FixJ family response regulator